MQLNSIFEDYFKDEQIKTSDEVIWEEDPVSFKEFVHSPLHMNFPPYSQRQLDAMEFMFGEDGKTCFENEHSTCILIWGKGCIAGTESLFDEEEKQYYTIKELFDKKKSISVKSYNEKTQKFEIKKASIPWVSGNGELFKIITELKKSIVIYKEHKFLTKNGWKNAQDIDLIKQEQILTIDGYERIISVEYIGKDDYYDLEVEDNQNYICNGIINHNSGKDTVSVHATLYVVYVLLCCKDPTALFKGVHADYLDILNVAYSYPQAIQIFFAKLRNAVKDWTWLKNKYRYVDSGKSVKDDRKYESLDIVNIKQDMIIFPKKVRAMAKCSQQNAAEGTNLLVWIADEFSAFSDKNNKSNAMEMFDTLRTSSTTRFQNYGKGFVISFTRYKNDPILKLADMYKDDINTYVDIASTFEVKPKSAFKGEWGTWNGIAMPKSFIQDFEINPEGSKAKYLCQPPDAEDPWITEVNLLMDSFEDRVPMFEFSEHINPTVNGNMIIKDITRRNFNMPNMTYVLAGDIGLTNDRSVITMFHDESTYLPDGSVRKRYVQDFTLTWIPDKKENRKVDINNIEYIIKKLIFEYKVPIVKIVFDHFASSQLLDELANNGIVSQQFTLRPENFVNFKNLLYTGSIKLILDTEVEYEMKRLVNGNRGVPDHPDSNTHDDRFRAICLAVNELDHNTEKHGVYVTQDGIFLKGRQKNVSGINIEGETIKARFHEQTSLSDDDIFSAIENVNK